MSATTEPEAQHPASHGSPHRPGFAERVLKAIAWLLLVLAILQRYVVRLGDSPRDVDVTAAGLLLLALAARLIAWRLSKP